MSIVSLVLALLGVLLIGAGAKWLVDQQKAGRSGVALPGLCLGAGIALLAFAIWNAFISPVL